EEWARIALAELKMRHTLCGGQYAERRYVTKLHQPLFRTAVILDIQRTASAVYIAFAMGGGTAYKWGSDPSRPEITWEQD
ncbi:MAG: hypothetical protein ABSF76_15280, partial [Opitutaceae bacterium]